MRITEIFQRCGDFTLELESPPSWIVNNLTRALGKTGDPNAWDPRDGAIVVTNGRVPPQTISLADSIYTGILTQRRDRFTFTGRGIELFLGTAQRPGPFRTTTPGVFENYNMNQVASFLVFPPFTANVFPPAGTIDWTWPSATTYAEQLDYTMALYSRGAPFVRCGWRANPDFSIDMGTLDSVVRTTPRVIVGRVPVADFAPFGFVRSLRGTVTEIIDSENVTNAVAAFGKDFGGGRFEEQTVFSGRPTTRDPVNGAEQPTTRLADLPQSSFTNEIREGAESLLELWENPRDQLRVTCPASANAHYWITRGDSIYVYDPIGGVEDGTNRVRIRGNDLFPETVSVVEMSYSIPAESGVWLLRHNGFGQVWTDISQWVRFNTSDTELVVATGKGPLDETAGKAARFEPGLADRLTSPLSWRGVTVQDWRQGTTSIGFTTTQARYTIVGGILYVQVDLSATSGGTNNQEIILEFDPSEWGGTEITGGDPFTFYDVSGPVIYSGTSIQRSSTTLAFLTSGQSNGIGRTPNFAVAAGDRITLQVSQPVE